MSAPPAPFRSNREALGFTLLLALLLLLPLLGYTGLLRRERVYPAIPSTQENSYYDNFRRIIFEEQGDIDVLCVGSSLVQSAFDAPYLSTRLSEILGRPAAVRVLGFAFEGDDLRYAALDDLLTRRRVRLVVIVPSLPWGFPLQQPHPWSKVWFDVGRHGQLLSGLPLQTQLAYYGEAVLGGPRRLLSELRPDFPPSSSASDFGALVRRRGLDGAPFVEFLPEPPQLTAEQLIHDWRSSKLISAGTEAIPPLQQRLLRATAERVRRAGATLVTVNLPHRLEGARLFEVADYSELLGKDTPLVGAPAEQLYRGLSQAQFELFFWDHGQRGLGHFNSNGSRFFSRAVLPALVSLLERAH